MKLYFSIAIITFLLCSSTQAQEQKAQWVTINSPQLKCWTCKERLDSYLTREKGPNNDAGILQWRVNMNAGNIRIQYIPTRISLDYIKTAINNAGFDADSTRATEDSYKKLPPICKRPEEGGGPKKGQPCNFPPQ